MREFYAIDNDRLRYLIVDELTVYGAFIMSGNLLPAFRNSLASDIPYDIYERLVINFMLTLLDGYSLFGHFGDHIGDFCSEFDYVLHWLRLYASKTNNHDTIRNILDTWIFICNYKINEREERFKLCLNSIS